MLRRGVQFHWRNQGCADFDAFLATLNHDKRKKIRQERRRVRDAGISFRWIRGAEASQEDWRFFVECYNRTYRSHHSTPYLNLEFFLRLGASLPAERSRWADVAGVPRGSGPGQHGAGARRGTA